MNELTNTILIVDDNEDDVYALRRALKKANVKYELYVYEGAQHAFNNDTAPTRYNAEAARLAWERTLKFFKDRL